jgi:nitrate reductase assembly molybdenum cofactor insertion protein NarJ
MCPKSVPKEIIVKPAEIGVAQQLAGQLLGYPTPTLGRQLHRIGEIGDLLPPVVGAPLATLAEHLNSLGLDRSAALWTDTFDSCCLYLSSPGDPAFADVAIGEGLADNERADFLPFVLEYAAARVVAGDQRGQYLLTAYGPAVAELAMALDEIGSPYLLAVEAVAATLSMRLAVML